MRALLLDGYGVKLGVSGTSLVVKDRSSSREVPVWEVDAVIVASSGVSITSRALRLMASAGIELVVLDSRGMPVSVTYLSHYSRTPDTRRAQYSAMLSEAGTRVASSIVYCKIMSQASTLVRLGQSAGASYRSAALSLKAKARKAMSVSGPLDEARKELLQVEAAAAREYWGFVASLLPRDLGFDGRDQEGDDPVNACLNYMYAVLYSLGLRALLLAGLDPYAGFLHVDRSGRPVLVYDYVEQFRAPVVDEPLVRMLMSGWRPRLEGGLLDVGSRKELIRAFMERLKDQALGAYRSMSLGEAIREYAYRLASSLRAGQQYPCYTGGEPH